jgi:hypothetical protein
VTLNPPELAEFGLWTEEMAGESNVRVRVPEPTSRPIVTNGYNVAPNAGGVTH